MYARDVQLDMTTEMKAEFDTLQFASTGQIKSAEKLLREKDSIGDPKVRRAKFADLHPDEHSLYGTYHEKEDYFEDTWIVQGSKPYAIIKDHLEYRCHILDQDGTRERDLCKGWTNSKEYTEGKKAKDCKHIYASILFERNQ